MHNNLCIEWCCLNVCVHVHMYVCMCPCDVGMLDPISGFSDPQTAIELEQKMKAAGCDITLHLYEDTPHSFLNALTEEGVKFLDKWGYGVPPAHQVTLAFDRLVGFFDQHLKGTGRKP